MTQLSIIHDRTIYLIKDRLGEKSLSNTIGSQTEIRGASIPLIASMKTQHTLALSTISASKGFISCLLDGV
jgi:hypothetical protein